MLLDSGMAANGASRNRERVDSSGLHQVERSIMLHVEVGNAGPLSVKLCLKNTYKVYCTVAEEQIAEAPFFSETHLSGHRIYKQRATFIDTVLHCP
jgi:hypothetical protein